MSLVSLLPAYAPAFGDQTLFLLPGGRSSVTLKNGYIPLLANFTYEDKAAKGLRKRTADDKPEPPLYFSALEVVRDTRFLFLCGRSGSGKTTFAKYLCYSVATGGLEKPQPVVRNETGILHEENWADSRIEAFYFEINHLQTLQRLIDDSIPEALQELVENKHEQQPEAVIVLDGIEKAGDQATSLLPGLLSLAERFENFRILILGDAQICGRWRLPSAFVRHEILPLLEAQRRKNLGRILGVEPSDVNIATGAAAANPGILALAVPAKHQGDLAEATLDSWLSFALVPPTTPDRLAATIFESFSLEVPQHAKPSLSTPLLTRQLLTARHLADLPTTDAALELFRREPLVAQPIIRSLLVRVSSSERFQSLSEDLIRGSTSLAKHGALLVSDFVDELPDLKEQIATHMLSIITESTFSVNERVQAGRVLSRLGDPRDLTALADIPAGNFIFGSKSHPNSQPQGVLSLGSYRIGVYPVVNQDYAIFVNETGRKWLSLDYKNSERLNAPATDLTWHDARAYCEWLTHQWRASKKISSTEQVRLPTEPEWERASNADLNELNDSTGPVYPWGLEWKHDAANSEETGLNTTCAVGLFPEGKSPYGCYDMAGQVWEWCTTLWGEDMATPTYSYPWGDDGREEPEAPESVRRVLRGGCFSSGKLKACGTYRGSLEPAGFWRGNGFRIVVSE
jgi:iron(II)-dependent oxidoreductase